MKIRTDIPRANLSGLRFTINGHVEDVQFMRPGYELDDPRMLTDECKAYNKGLQAVRLMGYSGCNSNFEREWKYRTPANSPFIMGVQNGDNQIRGNVDNCFDERANNPFLPNSFTQARSFPWEKAIDVCNYLETDFYINLPVLADQNYVHELAKLLKSRLKPTLNVYIEIGNELWNFGGGGVFKGFAMSFAAVHKMVIVEGDRTIMGDVSKGIRVDDNLGNFGNGTWWTGGMGAYTTARRWPAYRLKQFMDEFAKEFGFVEQGGVGGRIRAVLAGQIAYGWGQDYWFIGNEGVFFLEKQFGPGTAKKYLYGLAVTNYNHVDGGGKSDSEIMNFSVDQIFQGLYKNVTDQYGEYGGEGDCRTNSNGNCEGNEYEDILAFSKRFGLKVIAYEAGPEVSLNWKTLNNGIAAYNSPRMYDYTKHAVEKWYSWMGYDALYIKNGFFAQEGYGAGYAVSQYEGEISQQYRAYQDIMNSPAPAFTKERGGVIGATKVSDHPGWKIAAYRYLDWKEGQVVNEYGPAGRRRLDGTAIHVNDVYIIRNETSGNYALNLNMDWNGDNSLYDIYMDGKILKANWLLNQQARDANGKRWSDSLKFDIPYGTHAIHFVKKREGSIVLINMRFTLLKEGPPATPDLIYGDLVVCKGNTKAKYEVSPVDFSVCNYDWTGLPPGATILPKTTSTPITGQGTYKMYVDWANVAPGSYNLQVVASNQSKIAPNPWLYSQPRKFEVKVQTCGFDIAPTPVCLNQNTTFTPLPMTGVTEYRWDLGAGAIPSRSITKTTGEAVSAKYAIAGKIDVKLTTKNAAGEEKFYYNVVNVTSCNAPIVVSPLNYCQGQTGVPAVTATAVNGGTKLQWYTVATGGTALSNPPTPTTLTAGTQTFYVSQMNGDKESERTKLEVTISKT